MSVLDVRDETLEVELHNKPLHNQKEVKLVIQPSKKDCPLCGLPSVVVGEVYHKL